MLFRTVQLRRAGGFDLSTPPAEDQELWLRMGYAQPAVFIPSVVVEQRARGGGRDEAGTARIERAIRQRFVDQLTGPERIEAERLVESRAELKGSVAAFADGDFRSAARHILRATRCSPSVMSSPIIGPSTGLALAKAVAAGALPRPAGLVMRRGLRELRSFQRRDPMPGRLS
jgi:hypothetical protein